jgi:hypothetical protein
VTALPPGCHTACAPPWPPHSRRHTRPLLPNQTTNPTHAPHTKITVATTTSTSPLCVFTAVQATTAGTKTRRIYKSLFVGLRCVLSAHDTRNVALVCTFFFCPSFLLSDITAVQADRIHCCASAAELRVPDRLRVRAADRTNGTNYTRMQPHDAAGAAQAAGDVSEEAAEAALQQTYAETAFGPGRCATTFRPGYHFPRQEARIADVESGACPLVRWPEHTLVRAEWRYDAERVASAVHTASEELERVRCAHESARGQLRCQLTRLIATTPTRTRARRNFLANARQGGVLLPRDGRR